MRNIHMKSGFGACLLAIMPTIVALPGVDNAALANDGYNSFGESGAPSWEGFFVGGLLQGNRVTAEADLVAGSRRDYSDTAAGFGIYGGFNMGLDSAVLGFEGDLIQITGDEQTESISSLTVSRKRILSARTKLGIPVTETVLGYGTVGLVAGGGEVKSGAASANAVHLGWTIGVGADIALVDNIIARVEYRYTSLGDKVYNIDSRNVSVGFDSHDFNVGVAYKF